MISPRIFTFCYIVLLLLVFIGPGCSKDLPRLSGPQLEAVNHNLRGIKAEARGNHELALEEFSESLRINGSVDNTEGKLVALVNISRVNRHTGDADSALKAVNQALELVTPKSDIFSEVAFEKSSVELQLKNLAGAQEWAAKSIAAATGSKTTAATNLLARILYLGKQHDAAKEQADKALILSRNNSQTEEEANALRLLGILHSNSKRTTEALDAFGKALQLDKTLGKSRKIAADLRGIADVYAYTNSNAEAISFYGRAQSVSMNDGDRQAAAEDLLLMARLHDKMGNHKKFRQLMEERESLLKETEKQ
ncbi:TPR domain protein [Geotalea daltonii FRC-32]|uniref:TPR domain protein n=1 Tax=Geotalea daltonii (strain DSM 22248 / JCM 15807 / FRC-32) TaxID=316067 RepID=B9M1F2_GEODF|nr:tetratricopeptide repeat protein [Geotalea daltonii]ACM21034.1 TPR domain protein [Geotalea daltonii FRC-32]